MNKSDPAAFRAVFGSMSEDHVKARMCLGLPAQLEYSLGVEEQDRDIFRVKFTALAGGLTVIAYSQKINLAEKVAYQGDTTIDPDLQRNHTGTYLVCNNLLLRRECGLTRSVFQTDFMGGYAWQRMGALMNPDPDVAGKLEDSKRSILFELDYLQRRLGQKYQVPDLDRPDGVWAVADMSHAGFLDRLSGYFNTSAAPGFEIWDTLDHRLTGRAGIMKSTYQTDPPRISVGQLVLYGKTIPCYFDLRQETDLARRQWQRIRAYMAAKSYPGLEAI